MKGDFSRDTFDPKNHYSRVLMQQGRVQTDADWNEQGAQVEYRLETEATDVIGACGAPIHQAGFAITSDGKTLFISEGRMYVDGILAENETDALDYFKQPDLPIASAVAEVLKKAGVTYGMVYLDVWQRHITALDAPQIREVALGGPDTTTRVKVVWQVKVLPVKGGGGDPAECKRLTSLRRRLQAKLDGMISSGASASDIEQLKNEIADLDKKIVIACGGLSCDEQIAEWEALVAAPTGLLNARTSPPQATDDLCLFPPSVGYTRLENQLYRVEIHQGGNFPADAVTFKWSRDNGTVVTLIESLNGSQVTVRDVGPDDVLGFANGQFVEVIDDALELNGQPGELIQIVDVNTATRVITLASAPTLAFDPARHPKLRRWDSAGDMKIDGSWQVLEGGVEVQFANGTYASGDYWLIPARTATGDIEWPRDATNATIAQPRRGTMHHYCRLALVSIAAEQLGVTADCRKVFPPLTELTTGQVPSPVQAFHVVAIRWRNDDLLDAKMLIKAGLEIKFDTPPDPRALNSGAFIVTIEPVNLQAGTGGGHLRDVFVLDGTAQVGASDPTVIEWHINPSLENVLLQLQDSAHGQEPRVRVRLIGAKLWSQVGNQILYLDGLVFGQPSLRTDNKTPRTDLILPSGNGARTNDFESWFYLGKPLPQLPTPVRPSHPLPRRGGMPVRSGHEVSAPGPTRKRRRRTPQ